MSDAKCGVRAKQVYRPEIDGLRAIAVLAVLLYHGQVVGFGGGNTGVDIFFVISGYLITALITADLSRERFSLIDFYKRRVRRIMPSLLFTLAICTPIAWMFLIPAQLQAFSSALVSGILFSLNMLLYFRSNDYFGNMTDTIPLMHLWSLGVEEQFYLLYPVFLIGIWRYITKNILLVLILTAFTSLIASVIVSNINLAASFYLLPTRAWEILLGAIVAVALAQDISSRLPAPLKSGLVYAGFALLIAPIFLLNNVVGFPWPWALPSVIGTALVLAMADSSHPVGRLLSAGPMRHIGLISFSAYLWHFLLLAFLWTIMLHAPSLSLRLATLALTLILAELTWRFIEQPMRLQTRTSWRKFTMIVGITSATLIGIGVVGWYTHGAPERMPERFKQLLHNAEQDKAMIEKCNGRKCIIGDDGPINIALFGDSHVAVIRPALNAVLIQKHRRAMIMSYGGCPPVLIPIKLPSNVVNCEGKNRTILNQINKEPAIKTVILAARWTNYFERTAFEDPEIGIDHRSPNMAVITEMEAILRPAIKETVLSLLRANKQVILVYPVPEAGANVINYIMKSGTIGKSEEPFSTSYSFFRARNQRSYAALDSIGEHTGLIRLYPARHLCNTRLPQRCILSENHISYYFDDNHLTKEGAKIAYSELSELLAEGSH
jgi:peptidoglycan/LPS O-acetylase OafA/YrhL